MDCAGETEDGDAFGYGFVDGSAGVFVFPHHAIEDSVGFYVVEGDVFCVELCKLDP